jgi:PRTRC genetic system ThiF family protein
VDGDKVSKANVGRQSYGMNEVGSYKAELMVSRINRFYGFEWLAICEYFDYTELNDHVFTTYSSNFIITAIDSVPALQRVKTMFERGQAIKNGPEYFPHFWIDMGNTKTTGNVTVACPALEWPDKFVYESHFEKEVDEGPSCTLAMALNRQDLFVNSQAAIIGAKWLWECLRSTEMDWRGAFFNLDNLNIRKLKVTVTNAKPQGIDAAQQQEQHDGQPGATQTNPPAIKDRKSKNRNRSRKRHADQS